MNCEEIANLKDGYLDGELDARDQPENRTALARLP